MKAHKIRPRLADLPSYAADLNHKGRLNELPQWREQGGVLYLYSRIPKDCEIGGAFIELEAPFSADDQVELMAELDRTCEVIVYQPPSWVGHRNQLTRMHPTAETCTSVYKSVLAHAGRNMRTTFAAFAEIIGYVPGAVNLAALEDDELVRITGLDSTALHFARQRMSDYITGPFAQSAWQLILRYEPKVDEQHNLWTGIREKGTLFDKVYLISQAQLYDIDRNYKRLLKMMRREGFVEKKSVVTYYVFSGLEPDYRLIQHEHDEAHARFAQFAELVNQLGEYS